MKYDSSYVPSPGKDTQTHEISLKKGDTAWMPGTTKHLYHGPATIRYTIYPDGEVNAESIVAAEEKPEELTCILHAGGRMEFRIRILTIHPAMKAFMEDGVQVESWDVGVGEDGVSFFEEDESKRRMFPNAVAAWHYVGQELRLVPVRIKLDEVFTG